MISTEKKVTGRPREEHVPTEKGHCEVHGNVEFRLHKKGLRTDGSQRYVRRCPACHTESENLRRKK